MEGNPFGDPIVGISILHMPSCTASNPRLEFKNRGTVSDVDLSGWVDSRLHQIHLRAVTKS